MPPGTSGVTPRRAPGLRPARRSFYPRARAVPAVDSCRYTAETMPDVATERPRTDAGQRTDGGALMARTLRERGVTTVFALPGGHILPVSRRVHRRGHQGHRHPARGRGGARRRGLGTGDRRYRSCRGHRRAGFCERPHRVARRRSLERPLVMLAGRTSRNRQGRGAVGGRRSALDRRADREVGGGLLGHRPVPRYVAEALHRARNGCPGAVYLEVDSHAALRQGRPTGRRSAGVSQLHQSRPPVLRPTSVRRCPRLRGRATRLSSPAAARSGPGPAPRSGGSPSSRGSR